MTSVLKQNTIREGEKNVQKKGGKLVDVPKKNPQRKRGKQNFEGSGMDRTNNIYALVLNLSTCKFVLVVFNDAVPDKLSVPRVLIVWASP